MPRWTRVTILALLIALPLLLAAVGPAPEPCAERPRLTCERIKTSAQNSIEAAVAPDALAEWNAECARVERRCPVK